MNLKLFSRTLRMLFLCMLAVGISETSYAQVRVTATAGTTTPTFYPTVSDAFAAINAGTYQGVITVDITANITEPAAPTALVGSGTGSAVYTSVLLRPDGGNFTINSAATPTGNRGIIELNGADNVTIDGDDPATVGTRNLTIQAATSTATGVTCVRLSSSSTTGVNGADNNTVKNCIIIGSRSSATSTTVSYGINMSNYSTTSMTTGAYSSLNTLIENNEIKRVYHGVYANGGSSTYPNTGVVIRNNTIGSATSTDNIGFRGIYCSNTSSTAGASSAIIEGNDISVGDYGTSGYSATIAGIELAATNAGCVVNKNNIHDINQPSVNGYGAHGIYVTSGTNNSGITITNNFIRDCKMDIYQSSATSTFIPTGVYFTGGATNVIFNHNTILMNDQLTTNATYSSFCVNASTSSVTFAEFQNNILVNNHSSTAAYAFYTGATSVISAATVNNNNYYAPGGRVGYYSSAARISLSDWQTATSKDAASVNVNPSFVSSTDLHLSTSVASALESGGAITTLTTDIDGQTRPGPAGSINGGGTAPDIGADEFDGIPLPANEIAATVLVDPINGATIASGQSFAPQATFVNNGSAIQTNVPVRYQIVDATNNIIYNVTSTIASLAPFASSTVSFSSATIPINGTYTIKAIAELPGDAVVTNDTLSGSIDVQSPLCGIYNIGAAQPFPFDNIANAVARLNSVGVSCPVIFSLDDVSYTETGSIVFNQNIAGVSATNTVTLKPSVGVAPTVTGSVASGPFIRIQSSNIVIDGSNAVNGTTRDLTITNSNTTTPTTIYIASLGIIPTVDVQIKNSTIINGINTSNAIVMADNAASNTGGYFNNITIQNNSIQKAYNGLFINAATAVGNGSGILITENSLNTSGGNAIRFTGLYLAGIDGGIVTNNIFGNFDPTSAEVDKGINLAANTVNTVIRGNTISDLGYTGTSTYNPQGVYIASAVAASNIVVDSNYISNFTSTGNTTVNLESGIMITGATGGINVTRNRITNIKNNNTNGYAALGIYLNSSLATANILVANNFISDIAAYGNSTVARNGHGIYSANGGGYNIYHNSIYLNSDQTAATGISAAITIGSGVSTTTASIDIQNNIFSNEQTVGNRYAIYSGVTAANNANVYSSLNYNDYFSAGSNVAYFSAAVQDTLADLQAAFVGQNLNSIGVQPLFFSAIDLHLQNASANIGLDNMGTATSIAGITTDIDGQTRPLGTATDMGADEFTLVSCSGSNGGTATAAVTNFCVEGSTTLSTSGYSEGVGASYQWEVSTDGTVFSALGTETNPLNASTGTITDTMYYRLAVTCSSVTGYSSVETVFVHTDPIVSISPATTSPICAPATQLFTATDNASAPIYVWRMNGTDISASNAATYSASATGNYDVVVTDGGTGCKDTSISAALVVNPQPSIVTITPSPSEICSSGMADTLSVVGGVTANSVIFSEDFNGTTNSWTTINNSTGGTPANAAWILRPDGYVYGSTPVTFHSNDNTQFYLTNSDDHGSGGITSTILQSPVFSTLGYQNATLNYHHYLRALASTYITVEASLDATTWDTLYSYTGSSVSLGSSNAFADSTIVLPTIYDNQSTVYVRFQYWGDYDWYWAIDNVTVIGDQLPVYTWSPIGGLFNDDAAISAYAGANTDTVYAKPTDTTVYAVTVTNNFGCINSDTVTVNVVQPVSITTQPPTTASFCEGSILSLNVVADNATGYQWYNGSTMLVDGGDISGATSATLLIANVDPIDAGSYTVEVIGGAICGTTTSTATNVTINPSILGNTISASQTVCSGSTPAALTGSTPTGGDGTNYAYMWQSSTTSATAGFADATGTNNTSGYTPGALTQNTWYRRYVVSGSCTDTSGSIEITVGVPVTGNVIAAAQAICSGSTPAPLTGSLNSLYQDFTGLTSTSAVTSTSLTPYNWTLVQNGGNLLTGGNVNSYGRTGGNGSFRGNNYGVSAGVAIAESNTFTASNAGGSLSFDVASNNYEDGFGPYGYVDTLRVYADAGSGLVLLKQYMNNSLVVDTVGDGIVTAAATASGFVPSATQWTTKKLSLPTGTTKVRFEFSSGWGNQIYVDQVQVDSASFLWMSSTTDATTGFTAAAGANTSSVYVPGALTQTTWYKRVASSGGGCTPDSSNVVEITVGMPVANNTIAANQTICSGSTPAVFTGTTPTGGDGSNYTYTWESSTTSATAGFTAASGTNNTSGYAPAPLTVNTWYRRVVTSGTTCDGDTSNVVAITVNAMGSSLASTGSSSTSTQGDGTSSTYYDVLNCAPIATITDASGGNVLGSVTASVVVDATVQTANGQKYLQRHYDISPTNNGAATLVLYALQSEFTDYNTAPGSFPAMPTTGSNSDPNIPNIRVTKYSGTAFTQPAELITPISVNWNATNNWWEITINVTSFSTFYIHTGSVNPLEIVLRDISATNVGKRNRIDWTSSNEKDADKYELERSVDGVRFEYINTVKAKGEAGSYSYWDENPVTGINYYRLKMYDLNRAYAYSKVVNATVADKGVFAVIAYPNPLTVGSTLTVEVKGVIANNAVIVVTDMAGKLINRMNVTDLKTTLNLNHLASGIYFVRYTDDMHSETIKVNKD